MEFFKHFASLADLVDWLDATPSVSRYNSSRKKRTGDWGGTRTWEEAQRLVREGWPEGRALLDKAMQATAPLTQARSRILAQGYDVGGAYPMVPLAVAGDPACMITVGEQERAPRPYVRFHLSCGASGGISAAVITARGATILAWVDALEEAGARCEIMLNLKAADHEHECGFTCMIKRADESLDLDRMAYALINPAMLRRHAFAFIERSDAKITEAFGLGYGQAASMPPEGENVVCFDHAMLGDAAWRSPVTASAHVKEAIMAACGESLHGMLDAA